MTYKRYEKNLGAFSPEEQRRVSGSRACVVGCGGLGGYVINCLARFGVGTLVVADGDCFSESNLNRQLFAASNTLGKNKATASTEIIKLINPETELIAHPVMLTEENARQLLKGSSIAIDCLDNIPARRVLAGACEALSIPLVHGAVSGLFGQVSCVYPGGGLFDKLYPDSAVPSPVELGNPVFAPQLVASIQSCEAVKILAGRETPLRNKVLYIDLSSCSFELIDFL